ncbi:MAG: hypothetical protein GY861_27195 [bacterium]|nr:hypothetical protein [bacterium]
MLKIGSHTYEVGGKVSTLKAAGKPPDNVHFPYFALIDVWIEVLGDSAEDSPLKPEHWKRMNQIVYNDILPPFHCLNYTNDRQKTKAYLLEMV